MSNKLLTTCLRSDVALRRISRIGLLFTRLKAAPLLVATFFDIFVLAGCSTTRLPDPLAAGWQGKPVCEQLLEDQRHRILRCTFPPNVGHERHFHAPHFGYALTSARMQITDKDGVRVVDVTGGSRTDNPGVDWHEILNVGDTTLIYLLVEPR